MPPTSSTRTACSTGFQARLKCGHQQRCRNTLAGDVSHGDEVGWVAGSRGRTWKDVVAVTGYRVRGPGGESDFDAGHWWRVYRQEPHLDLACDLEVSLHNDAIGDLQHQQYAHQQTAPELEIDVDAVDARRRCP